MKKWSDLMIENKERIMEKMEEAFIEAEGGMSGWSISVEMDQEGDVWLTGILNQNSQSRSSWEGKTFIVDSINTWNLDYDEYEMLINYLPECDAIYEAFKQHKIDEDEDADFVEFMKDNYPDQLDKWNEEAYEFEIDSFRDATDERFDLLLENQLIIEH